MKNYLLLMMLLLSSTLQSQTGNTINEAIDVNGVNTEIDLLDYNSATKSQLDPECGSNADVFYKHTVLPGANKVTIGMASVGVLLSAQFDYQILLAPNGDISSLQEITCDSYTVPILVSANFEQVINDVNPSDVYYLRVYRPSGLGSFLSELISGTVISMTSEFDSTLSTISVGSDAFGFIVKKDKIELLNNSEPLILKIYSIDGKFIISKNQHDNLDTIDISNLKNGIYVLNLVNSKTTESLKFLKN